LGNWTAIENKDASRLWFSFRTAKNLTKSLPQFEHCLNAGRNAAEFLDSQNSVLFRRVERRRNCGSLENLGGNSHKRLENGEGLAASRACREMRSQQLNLWIQNAGGKSRNSTITRWSKEYIRTGCEVDTDRQRTLLTLIVHLSDPPRAKLRFMQFGDSYTCSYCLQVIKWDHHRTRPTKRLVGAWPRGAKPLPVSVCNFLRPSLTDPSAQIISKYRD